MNAAREIHIGKNFCSNMNFSFIAGDGSVIGSGSVVTKDIPAGVLAFGNPCRVQRKITEQDSMYRNIKR